MDKKDLERRLEAAEKQNIGLLDEIKNLKEKLAEMQEKQEIPDLPEFESPVVWAMDSNLNVFNYRISPYIEPPFNAFHTKEMAQEFAEKCKLIAMMLHCKWYICRDFMQDWDNYDDKFTVWYNHSDNEWTTDVNEIHEMPSIYFSTEESSQKCADWLNAHCKEDGNGI